MIKHLKYTIVGTMAIIALTAVVAASAGLGIWLWEEYPFIPVALIMLFLGGICGRQLLA